LKINYFFKNNKGRDFICGDIHGSFTYLEEILAGIHFNPLSDRLFSVGDIIDRGAESKNALQYLQQHWFYCVRGNHEQMFLDWCTELEPTYRNDAFYFHMNNGGLWVADYLGVHIQKLADDILLDPPVSEQYPKLKNWINEIECLPFAIEIKSSKKKVGIVHAEIPESITWPSLEAELNKTNVAYSLLFSRKYIRSSKLKKYSIKGIDEIYSGHTIVKTPQKIGNVHYIDTGAFSRQSLTLVEIIN
jgi:serine/threonine protein phosphatase 1